LQDSRQTLSTFLENDIQGRTVLDYYKANGELEKKVQSLLARRIILNELNLTNGAEYENKFYSDT